MNIVPPWTSEQVSALNDWQQSVLVHPFICPRRSNGGHRQHWGNLGTLAATTDGWVCVDCDYTQLWAHDFMADGRLLAAQRRARQRWLPGDEGTQP